MNYVSLKHLPKIGRNLMLLSSLLVLSGLVVDADKVDDEIITVNINESAKVVVSDMIVDAPIDSNLKGVDLQSVSFGSSGFSIGEMLAKPKPVILDSCLVPDGDGVCNSINKTYMAYTAVTDRKSAQYALLNGEGAHTDETTGLRMIGDRYCIATGTFYARTIGTKLNLVMANGNVVECILGDVKSDAHTDPTHRFQAEDGSVAEFIVDRNYFHSTAQYPSELQGRISRIEVVE